MEDRSFAVLHFEKFGSHKHVLPEIHQDAFHGKRSTSGLRGRPLLVSKKARAPFLLMSRCHGSLPRTIDLRLRFRGREAVREAILFKIYLADSDS